MKKSTTVFLSVVMPVLIALVLVSTALAMPDPPPKKGPPPPPPTEEPKPPVEEPVYVALSDIEAALALAAAASALPDGTEACGAFGSNTHGWVFLKIGDFADCAGKDPLTIVCDDGAGNFSTLNASDIMFTDDGNIKYKSSQHGTCVIAG